MELRRLLAFGCSCHYLHFSSAYTVWRQIRWTNMKTKTLKWCSSWLNTKILHYLTSFHRRLTCLLCGVRRVSLVRQSHQFEGKVLGHKHDRKRVEMRGFLCTPCGDKSEPTWAIPHRKCGLIGRNRKKVTVTGFFVFGTIGTSSSIWCNWELPSLSHPLHTYKRS